MSETSQSRQSSQELAPGIRLGHFTLGEVLGKGGFSITYKAYDNIQGLDVVIKENLPFTFAARNPVTLEVCPHSRGDKEGAYEWSVKNFIDEAGLLTQLHHPHIVKVRQAFRALGTAYYVMPYVKARSLDVWTPPFRAPDEEWIRNLLAAMLSALDYMHSRNILHRDIKPSNILMTEKGKPILIDFGAARQLISERTKTVVESEGYTPYEQLQSHGKVGAWTDLYALGCTMYKLMTGITPPKSADRVGPEAKPLKPLARRRALRRKYSRRLLRSVDKAMSVSTSQRWQCAEDWIYELSRPNDDHSLRRRVLGILCVLLVLCGGMAVVNAVLRELHDARTGPNAWYYSSDPNAPHYERVIVREQVPEPEEILLLESEEAGEPAEVWQVTPQEDAESLIVVSDADAPERQRYLLMPLPEPSPITDSGEFATVAPRPDAAEEAAVYMELTRREDAPQEVPEAQRLSLDEVLPEAIRDEAIAVDSESQGGAEAWAEFVRLRPDDTLRLSEALCAERLDSGSGVIRLKADELFLPDSSTLRQSARDSLLQLAALIHKNPDTNFIIEGHTDSFGGRNYNALLSLQRAAAVREWLVQNEVPVEKVHIRPCANSSPLVSIEGSREEQALNRRVEIHMRNQSEPLPPGCVPHTEKVDTKTPIRKQIAAGVRVPEAYMPTPDEQP